MADENVCQQFQPHAWKKDLCVKCMKARNFHKSQQQVPVPVKRKSRSVNNASNTKKDKDALSDREIPNKSMADVASDVGVRDPGETKEKVESEVTGDNQAADSIKNPYRKKSAATSGSAKKGNVQNEGDKKSPASGQQKPVVATKPRPPVAKTKQMQDKMHSGSPEASKISAKQDRYYHAVPQQRSAVNDVGSMDTPTSCGPVTAVIVVKSKPRVNAPARPPGDPPEVPPHGGRQVEKKAEVSKITDTRAVKGHVKGQEPETTSASETRDQKPKEKKHSLSKASTSSKTDDNDALNDLKCKDNSGSPKRSMANGQVVASGTGPPTDVKDAVGGGSHYYHKYDITASLQRKMNKPVDKRMADVKEDLQLTRNKKTLVMPYTVVDVTGVRRECEDNHPPRLPSTPPPDHPSSEPTSRESTLRYSSNKNEQCDAELGMGSQTSVKSEPLPSPKLPIILQEEAQKMREESKSPPPHRMVPIIIRPQHSDNSDTYEPVEDHRHVDDQKNLQNEAETMAGLTTDADFADYTATDVGCLSFGRQSKLRAVGSKSNAFEAKMAALANLDLLKGITSKVQAPDVSAEQVSVDAEAVVPQAVATEHPECQKANKKAGKSFFKKLLKLGNREAGSSGKETTGEELDGVDLGVGQPSDVMARSAYDEHSVSSTSHPAQPVSPIKHEKMVLSEVQKVLAQRQLSAPDICRELTNLKNLEQKEDVATGAVDQVEHQTSYGRRKKKLNISVQPVSPAEQEEKINNIKQAQDMALSLGIDKVSSRHKGDEPLGSSASASAALRKPSLQDQPSQILRDGPREHLYGSSERSQTDVQTTEKNIYGAPTAPKPCALSPKPNIPAKFKKSAEGNETVQKVAESANLPSVIIPELAGECKESCPLVSPTSSDSSSLSYAPDSGATSPQPTSPSSEAPPGGRSKKSRMRTDMKTSKIARSMMPAPPPPPPLPPASHEPGVASGSAATDSGFPSPDQVSPDQKPGGYRRTGALTHTDISAPILTSPDLMSRSFSTPSTEVTSDKQRQQEQVECVRKHSRNKTVTEGIVVEACAGATEDSELDFSSLGRVSHRFLNRALPPTPGESAVSKGKTKLDLSDSSKGSVSIIEENEYELVSLDGDAADGDEAQEGVERPAYEDIEDGIEDEEGLYSNPADLEDDTSEQNNSAVDPELEEGELDDGYLEPVSTSNDDDMQINDKQILSGSRLSHPDLCLTVYTNTDTSVYGQKPARTIKEAFCKMAMQNVETLSLRAQRILGQLIPKPVIANQEMKWSDFMLKSKVPILQVGDLVFYEAKTNKLDPNNCYVMISQCSVSRNFTESCSCGSISPVKVFMDKVSRDFFITQSKSGHFRSASSLESDISILSYNKLLSLDTAIHNLDSLFATDLNEYERVVCFWITHIVGATLDVCAKWPHLQSVPCDHIAVVTVPSSEQSFPILVIPDFICEQESSVVLDQLTTLPQCDWNQISSDIIRILFKLLRLIYKDKTKDPGNRIPIRSKYSTGLRAFVDEIMKDKNSPSGIVLAKCIVEVMLWGPCMEDLKQLMSAENQDESFQIWLELKRNLVINMLAMGHHRSTLDFANSLSFLYSVTPKLLMDTTSLLCNVDKANI